MLPNLGRLSLRPCAVRTGADAEDEEMDDFIDYADDPGEGGGGEGAPLPPPLSDDEADDDAASDESSDDGASSGSSQGPDPVLDPSDDDDWVSEPDPQPPPTDPAANASSEQPLTLEKLIEDLPERPDAVPDPVDNRADVERLENILTLIRARVRAMNVREEFNELGGIRKLGILLETMIKKYHDGIPNPVMGVRDPDDPGVLKILPIKEALHISVNLSANWRLHSAIEEAGIITALTDHVQATEGRNVAMNQAMVNFFGHLLIGNKISQKSQLQIVEASWTIFKHLKPSDELTEVPLGPGGIPSQALVEEHDKMVQDMEALQPDAAQCMWDAVAAPDWRNWADKQSASPGGTTPTSYFDRFVNAVLPEGVGEWSLPEWKRDLALRELPQSFKLYYVQSLDTSSFKLLLRLLLSNLSECAVTIMNATTPYTPYTRGRWGLPDTMQERDDEPLNEQLDRAKMLLPCLEVLFRRSEVRQKARRSVEFFDDVLIPLLNNKKLVAYVVQCIHRMAKGDPVSQEMFQTLNLLERLPRSRAMMEKGKTEMLNEQFQVDYSLEWLLQELGSRPITPHDMHELIKVLPPNEYIVSGSASHVRVLNDIGMERLWKAYNAAKNMQHDEMTMSDMYGLLGRLVRDFPAAQDACRNVKGMFDDIVLDYWKNKHKGMFWARDTFGLVYRLVSDNRLNTDRLGLFYKDDSSSPVNLLFQMMEVLDDQEINIDEVAQVAKELALKCLIEMVAYHPGNREKVRRSKSFMELLLRHRDSKTFGPTVLTEYDLYHKRTQTKLAIRLLNLLAPRTRVSGL